MKISKSVCVGFNRSIAYHESLTWFMSPPPNDITLWMTGSSRLKMHIFHSFVLWSKEFSRYAYLAFEFFDEKLSGSVKDAFMSASCRFLELRVKRKREALEAF